MWGKSWKVVTIPLILLCGFVGRPGLFILGYRKWKTHDDFGLVSGIGQTYNFARGRDIHSAFTHILTIWNGLVFSFSLATNLTATVLIAVRVW